MIMGFYQLMKLLNNTFNSIRMFFKWKFSFRITLDKLSTYVNMLLILEYFLTKQFNFI